MLDTDTARTEIVSAQADTAAEATAETVSDDDDTHEVSDIATVRRTYKKLCTDIRNRHAYLPRVAAVLRARECHQAILEHAPHAPPKKKVSFAKSLARDAGVTSRSVEYDLQIGDHLSEATREGLANTRVAHDYKSLLSMARLGKRLEDDVPARDEKHGRLVDAARSGLAAAFEELLAEYLSEAGASKPKASKGEGGAEAEADEAEPLAEPQSIAAKIDEDVAVPRGARHARLRKVKGAFVIEFT